MAKWFWRRFLILDNVFSLFYNYLPCGKGLALRLNKLESPSPRKTLCQVWLKLAQWFWGRRWKCEKVTDGLQTDDGRQVIRKAHLNFQLRWAKKIHVYSRKNMGKVHLENCFACQCYSFFPNNTFSGFLINCMLHQVILYCMYVLLNISKVQTVWTASRLYSKLCTLISNTVYEIHIGTCTMQNASVPLKIFSHFNFIECKAYYKELHNLTLCIAN